MPEVLQDLALKCPGEDHGDPRYGAYSMVGFQVALSKRGYDLILLNKTGTFKKKSRANVGERYVFIDSDSYFYVKSEGDA
ncbi:TPA: hypothetical protein N0F65_002602 [Lagenidium giganteum]|uniref:Uncharacterized protein n=1 Tax=Lagenidium giganteum TaxID=4803 RepID=A0AAV2Z0H1_9STRA|nr:TPA: hypothetical protein N0F65_002602 [Lagenidium giganteum]